MPCACHFIPTDVISQLATADFHNEEVRRRYRAQVKIDTALRGMREQHRRLAQTLQLSFALAPEQRPPELPVFDCRGGRDLPGWQIADPANSADPIARNVASMTAEVLAFYRTVFGRNSIDAAGAPLPSSIHFNIPTGQAIWSGGRVVYSDADNVTFAEPTLCDDLVCHEATHGVVQNTLQLPTSKTESGGLNESIADVFGIMFRQWRANQSAAEADWLLGTDLVGPALRDRGTICVRDFRAPDSAHCLLTQFVHHDQFQPQTSAHISSGIANHAFYRVATAIGGPSWEVAGRIWYQAIITGPAPGLSMKAFADRTREAAANIFPGAANTATAVDNGWTTVGL